MAKVYGVQAKNPKQEEALEALTNPEIDLVILEGCAGSGKTLLTLAAGLQQIFDIKRFDNIVFTRAPIGVGEDIGFLPGTEQEKMLPYCGALLDNLEVLHPNNTGKFDRDVLSDILGTRIKVLAMLYMRGRSFANKFIIVDEVQNIPLNQLKVLITRIGQGSKLVLLGDIDQVDNKKLSSINNGLSDLLSKVYKEDFIRYVKLEAGERSRLCTWASEVL